MSKPSDLELVRRAGNADAGCVEAIYDRHAASCFSLARRMLGEGPSAERVVGTAFLRLWRTAQSFDVTRGSVRTQLLESVHELCVDEIRDRANGGGGARPSASSNLPIDHGLPVELWSVLELAYFGGMTETEIADQLDVPVTVVKQRARMALEGLGGSDPRARA